MRGCANAADWIAFYLDIGGPVDTAYTAYIKARSEIFFEIIDGFDHEISISPTNAVAHHSHHLKPWQTLTIRAGSVRRLTQATITDRAGGFVTNYEFVVCPWGIM